MDVFVIIVIIIIISSQPKSVFTFLSFSNALSVGSLLNRLTFMLLTPFYLQNYRVWIPQTCDADTFLSQVEYLVNDELNLVAPVKSRRRVVRPNSYNTYVSDEATRAKRNRRKLERLWLRTGDRTILARYRTAFRQTSVLINESRSCLLSARLQSVGGGRPK